MVRIPNLLIRAVARTLAAIFAISVFLVPAILLNLAQTTALRFTIIFIATALLKTTVTAIGKAAMSEMFVAGAACAAALVASNGLGEVDSSGSVQAEANRATVLDKKWCVNRSRKGRIW